ncbi:Uncharacterized protein Rs2_16148 [Raphanus sativus]|nr:Uncharacterized protein Rs2_16148 [Raphanus sativus]
MKESFLSSPTNLERESTEESTANPKSVADRSANNSVNDDYGGKDKSEDTMETISVFNRLGSLEKTRGAEGSRDCILQKYPDGDPRSKLSSGFRGAKQDGQSSKGSRSPLLFLKDLEVIR